MEAERYIVVLDPYKWMPGYGENSVEVSTKKGEALTVVVTYDGEDGEEEQKEIKFTKVTSFNFGVFPGPVIKAEYNKNTPLSNFIEFPDSECARDWIEYYKNYAHSDRVVKHYSWIFTSENFVLEVFAEGVKWEEHSSYR